MRPALPEDAPAIGAVHVRSWQHAYRGMIADAFLDQLDAAQRGAGWALILAADPGRGATLVAEEDGKVIGFANVGPARDDDGDETVGEVRAIYLAPEVWGSGVGRTLMQAATDVLVAAGFARATLWVLEANERARRFYAIAGWAPDGGRRTLDGFEAPVAEVRYRRALRPVAAWR